MSSELFVNGELIVARKETHKKSKGTKNIPVFTTRMERLEYLKKDHFFDIRNVLDVKGLLRDIRANLHTYATKVNEWIQSNPVKNFVVTGIFTIILGVFSTTANAAFIQEYSYQVKSGERIESIAAAHGVTSQGILVANGLADINGKKILLPKVQDQTVTATSLNIRSQPNTSSSILGQYKKGDVVKVSFVEDGWAGILINGRVCFVSADYLAEKSNQVITPVKVQARSMYITATSLRVRTAASTNSAVIGSFKFDDRVSVSSVVNGWAQINYNGKTAFVSAAYLTSKEPTNTNSTVYVVKSGDTFSKISRTLGISVSSIQELNPTVDSSKLKIGQTITIPSSISSNLNQIKVTAHIGGIDPKGTFRFVTPDGKTHAANASGNMLNELFTHQGKIMTLTLEGARGQKMTLVSLHE